MENFNLKKFLVENKLTTNSRILRENDEQSPKSITFYSSNDLLKSNLQDIINRDFTWDIVNNAYGNKTKYNNAIVLTRERTLEGYLYSICRFFIENNKVSYQVIEHLTKDEVQEVFNGKLPSRSNYHFNGKFENIAVGETDDRGYFKIVKIG